MQTRDVDVLIVGSGLAGLAAALSIEGRAVTLLTPWMPPGGTASAMAQGGIAAAVGPDDSAELHAADTWRAGVGLGDPEAVRVLCGEAAAAIDWLERQGASFDRQDGHWALHREAAHSRARVLHIQHDRTGFGLTRALTRVARARPGLEVVSGHHAVALLPGPHGIGGVLTLDRESRPWVFRACETVLATGGIGQLYARTTNPRSACGDGLALALLAGARCAALEYVQFHPTALDVAADPVPLITEALRGAGAPLIDERGEQFMHALHPAGALAPRDVVARAVWQRTSVGGRVFLDARELLARQPEAYPSVRQLCASHHIDPARELIPVAPAAHYHMGGVAVDLDGRSSLGHLWACGEVACTGAHGANRLATNSLLEAVVFGRRLGHVLSAGAAERHCTESFDAGVLPDNLSLQVDPPLWNALRQLMWTHAGIVRDRAGLQAALVQIARLRDEAPTGQVLLSNRLRLAEALVSAALAQNVSCGAHFRADAPPATAAPPSAPARPAERAREGLAESSCI